MTQPLSELASELRPRRVLVTGATGGIGQRLLQFCAEAGVQLRALSRNPDACLPAGVELMQGDLTLARDVRAACRNVDLVFHLASYAPKAGEPEPEQHVLHRKVTVAGTKNLLDAARHSGITRLVFASSTRAIDGSDSLYARSKREAERLVTASGLACCTLRLAPVYGFAHKGSMAKMLALVDRGRFIPVPEFHERRSLVHVNDVVQALLLAALKPQAVGQIYTVTDWQTYSLRQLYEMMSEVAGRKPHAGMPLWVLRSGATLGDLLRRMTRLPMPLTRDKLDKLSRSAWFDAQALTELGYQPVYELRTALPQMLTDLRAAG